MARFSAEDRATIWEMRQAGVPVKRIAKHPGRQNSSLRKFIADAGGQTTDAERAFSSCGCPYKNARRSREVSLPAMRSESLPRPWAARPRRCVGRSTTMVGG